MFGTYRRYWQNLCSRKGLSHGSSYFTGRHRRNQYTTGWAGASHWGDVRPWCFKMMGLQSIWRFPKEVGRLVIGMMGSSEEMRDGIWWWEGGDWVIDCLKKTVVIGWYTLEGVRKKLTAKTPQVRRWLLGDGLWWIYGGDCLIGFGEETVVRGW